MSLSQGDLRQLARRYEEEARAEAGVGRKYRRLSAATALAQVACALGDPVLYERAVRIRSPRPNALEVGRIAEQYLRFGAAERALEWLTGAEEAAFEPVERLDLLARAYEKLGAREELFEARRQRSEGSFSFELFAEYAELLPSGERETACQHAVERATRSSDPGEASLFLLDLGEARPAAHLVAQRHENLLGICYPLLEVMAERLEQANEALAAVLCYRTLIEQILDAGRSKAYHHTRRYVDCLALLDSRVSDYESFPDHPQYFASLRRIHRRKHGFWRHFQAGERPGDAPAIDEA